MQSFYLNSAKNMSRALMELAITDVVTGCKIMDDGVVIQIEPSERFCDGQQLHDCKLVFKQGD